MEAVSVSSLQYVQKQLGAYKVESLDMLPAALRKQIRREARRIAIADVFGVDHKTDKDGNPIEQGIGAAGNVTAQHVEAYIKEQTERRPNGPEPGYEDHLARMRKQLAECEARRAAERARATADQED
jgi:hypothetical protein